MKPRQAYGLLIILLLYGSASLFHFVHNAVYIDDYPNLPEWITAAGVYITWFGITAVGVAGYALFYLGKCLPGLLAIAVYGALGLDGLAHYSLAPLSAHSFTMNLSIWLEALGAVMVLMAVAVLMIRNAITPSHA